MWNEAAGARRAVDALLDAAGDLVAGGRLAGVELVAVDDGSTDATADVLARAAADRPELRVVAHARNRGLGAAVRTGLAASTGDLVLYTDADLPADPAALATALGEWERTGAALVAAYRTDRRRESRRRRAYSSAWNGLTRLLLGLRVRDVNFAFKLLDGPTARSLALTTEGAFVDAELVARVQRGGGSIVQFGTPYRPRETGDSSLSSPTVIADMVRELWRLRPELRAAARGRRMHPAGP
ncbi:MAG: glycosyltransferase family 2 protein [Microthrixaceae bacterium]|nr:glycosyltransferase family 2 protein [Microthrixaceae bacterium]